VLNSHRIILRFPLQEGFKAYLEKGKHIMPCKTDLSYYNHRTGAVESSHSPNFHVVEDDRGNLLFKSKADGKLINVNITLDTCGEKSTRIRLKRNSSGLYRQIVLFEHIVGTGG